MKYIAINRDMLIMRVLKTKDFSISSIILVKKINIITRTLHYLFQNTSEKILSPM